MSVWVWAFANHKIDFDKFENTITLTDAIIHKLNKLCLSDNLEVCQRFKCNKGELWLYGGYDEDKDWPLTLRFGLGNYDLDVSENFIQLNASVFPYTHWFAPRNDVEREEISFWFDAIHSIVRGLGGDIIEYFPDNMLEPCSLMPDEVEDYKHLTMSKHLEIVEKQWPNICYSYEDAVRCWPTADDAPLLIERL